MCRTGTLTRAAAPSWLVVADNDGNDDHHADADQDADDGEDDGVDGGKVNAGHRLSNPRSCNQKYSSGCCRRVLVLICSLYREALYMRSSRLMKGQY